MLTLLAMLCLTPQDPSGGSNSAPTLAEVLEASARGRDRIRSIEADYMNRGSRDGGVSWTESGRFWIWVDGPRRRLRQLTLHGIDMGTHVFEEDYWSETSWSLHQYRSLSNSGGIRPKSRPFSENLYSDMFASMGTIGELSMTREPEYFLMLSTSMDDDFPEAVRRGSNASVAVVDGPDGPEVEVRYTSSFHQNRPYYHRVFLDPRRSHAIRRFEIRLTPNGPPMNVTTAEEFTEVEPGLFMATRIRSVGSNGLMQERRAISLRVNGPIDPESLVVEFPEGSLVSAEPIGTTHLWGKSGPEITFRNRDELEMYRMRALGNLHLRSLAGFGLLAAILIGIAAARRRSAKSRAKMSSIDEFTFDFISENPADA